MSANLKPQTAEIGSESEVSGRGLRWRRLQILATVAALVSFVAPMVIDLSLEPFLLAMAAPFVVGLLLVVKWPRVAAVWLGVVSLAVLLFSAPFLGEALTHPESAVDFVPLALFALATSVGAVASIPAFREMRGEAHQTRVPRRVATASTALLLAAIAWSLATFTQLEDAGPQAGDILVTTEDFAFAPKAVSTDSGAIGVAVTNLDNTRHTFSITELGVELNLPPGTTQRVTFIAEPGTYTFFCSPHPDMQGELVAG
jgi:plastocyanin